MTVDSSKNVYFYADCFRVIKIRLLGMVHCWYTIISEEGAQTLYRGLSPALLRQATYGTIKFGLYYRIKEALPGQEWPLKNAFCAVIAGSMASSIANPTDLLKVSNGSNPRSSLNIQL